MPEKQLQNHAIILFDGVCNLCNAVVKFIINHDHQGYYKFAALQSKEAKEILADPEIRKMKDEPLKSVVLIEKDRFYFKTDAVLRIFKKLPGLWPALYVFKILPRSFRDWLYDWIARNRYRWFGKRNTSTALGDQYPDKFL